MHVTSVPGTPHLPLTHSQIPFHNDGMFRSEPPRYLILYCQIPSSRGGVTLFARGDKVVARLDQKARRILTVFSFRIQLGSLKASRRLVQKHPRDGMPVLLFGDPDISANLQISCSGKVQVSRILRVLRASLADPQVVCYRHSWKRHDLLVFDNFKLLHARTGYTGHRLLKRVELSASGPGHAASAVGAGGDPTLIR